MAVKRLTRIFRLIFRRTILADAAGAGGFGVLVFAAWEIERIAGLVLAGGVLLFYSYREFR